MRKRTQIVHANPYAHIDANGRLAGATPIAEPVRSTSTPPAREYVGATRKLIEYDAVGRGVGSARQPRAEYAWQFTGEGLEVPVGGQLGAYYAQRIASGELFVGDGREAPLRALAKARRDALAALKADIVASADAKADDETDEAYKARLSAAEKDAAASIASIAETWSEQYPLDLQAEAATEIVDAEEKAAATRAAAAAKTEAAKPAATSTTAQRVAGLKKAREDALEAARKALGVKTSVAPPSNADAAGTGGPGVPDALAKAAKKETDR